jgi:hypothetical protein
MCPYNTFACVVFIICALREVHKLNSAEETVSNCWSIFLLHLQNHRTDFDETCDWGVSGKNLLSTESVYVKLIRYHIKVCNCCLTNSVSYIMCRDVYDLSLHQISGAWLQWFIND